MSGLSRHARFFCPLIFSPFPEIIFAFCLIFFPFFKKVFVTNFVTRITKFVTCVRKFVTAVTKFVINFFCQIVKIIKEEGKICSVSVIFLRYESWGVLQNVPTCLLSHKKRHMIEAV